MTFTWKFSCISALLFLSCNTGNLNLVADIPNHLKEVSAVETFEDSDLFWVIEDSGKGDRNYVYGIDSNGSIQSRLLILNSKNKDWEDLTTDKKGNLYIGDFGNNTKKRKKFTIYKVPNIIEAKVETTAEAITFTLPKGLDSHDFEAFIEHNNAFYIFSKDQKSGYVIKVPNAKGTHEAEFMTHFKLAGKDKRITSADISTDGKTLALLFRDRAVLLSDFYNDDFFSGHLKTIDFNHDSQKEGICFKNNETLIITDERYGDSGGNIYSISFKN